MIHALVLAAQLATADVSFADAIGLASQYEAALSPKDSAALVEAQGKALSAAMVLCGPAAGARRSFTIVAHVSMSGLTDRTWRNDDSAYAVCMEQHVMTSMLPVATGKAFHTSYELSFAP